MFRTRSLALVLLLIPGACLAQDFSQPHIYPQPFNLTGQYSKVKIQPVPTGARVTFYSSDRRKVAEAEIMGDTAFWDGRSKEGRRVAPGVYFYVVEAGGQVVASGRLYVKQD